jgi:hypothetical protein
MGVGADYDTVLHNTRVPLHRIGMTTGRARVTCAAAKSDRFLLSGGASYVFRPILHL